MAFKVNVSEKGKTYKVETDNESLIGKKIGEVISGSEVSSDLQGYDLEIKGTSDKAGFPGIKSEQGGNLRKVMFTKGAFFHKVKNKGVRKKKNVRGNEISFDTRQINTSVIKVGSKKLEDVFGKKEEVKEEVVAVA
jgi:small subunit ribosomal protein S6e